MAVKGIPEAINNYNLYLDGRILVGLTGEVALPKFEAMTQTISGPGIGGEFEEPIIGQFSSMEMEIPFRILDEDACRLMNQREAVALTLRAAQQTAQGDSLLVVEKPLRVALRGRTKGFDPGKLEVANGMDTSITVEIAYILIEQGGSKRVELDKLNMKYVVNGVDLLAKVRQYT